MTVKDLINVEGLDQRVLSGVDPNEKVYTLDEVISVLQHFRQQEGNLPVVVDGYEMGIDNILQFRKISLFKGGGGCCGTFEDQNWVDNQTKEPKTALIISRWNDETYK